MRDLFEALVNRILDASLNLGFICADLYNRQDEKDGDDYSVKTPCVFVEFLPVEWTELGGKKQAGEVTLRLHVCFQSYGSSESCQQGDLFQSQSMIFFDILESLHASLQGWTISVNQFSPLDRQRSEFDHSHDTLLKHIIEYNTTVIQCA
jgi:hypothetical protein